MDVDTRDQVLRDLDDLKRIFSRGLVADKVQGLYESKVRKCCSSENGAERTRGWIKALDWLRDQLPGEVRKEVARDEAE